METTAQDLLRKRLYSAGITSVVLLLLTLFLIAYKIVSPHLQFQNGNTTPSQQFALSVLQSNTNTNDYTLSTFLETAKEEAISVVKHAEPVVAKPLVIEDYIKAETLSKKYTSTLGQTSAETNTLSTEENGKGPDAVGTNSTELKAQPSGIAEGKFAISLLGRTIERPPHFKQASTEVGTVVVEITVNKAGEVIAASATGRGTTTSSAALKASAEEAAMSAKFSADTKFEQQTGTITIVYSYQ